MSMFNEDQQSYMRYLETIPPKHKCWCGWYKLGECPHCPAGKTCADKLETDPYWIKRLTEEREAAMTPDIHQRVAERTVPIYCVGCEKEVAARLTNGVEIYPHRHDLAELPFWICDACRNYVGCHYKTSTPTRPLGVIPTQELRQDRNRLHAFIDPLWKSQGWNRTKLYAAISAKLGRTYHTAETRDLAEIECVLQIVAELAKKGLL